jgi:peroxiredoxin
MPILLASGALLALTCSAQAAYQVGDVVDDFTLVDTEGISHSLYDYKGKIILLNFGEYWCGPCNSEWAVMKDDLWNPNKDQGVMIFTIGNDNQSAFESKADQFSGGLTNDGWPWLFDVTGQLYGDYGNGYIPFNALVDQDFRLIWSDAGWYGNFNTIQNNIDANLANVVVHQIQPRFLNTGVGQTVALTVTLTNRTSATQTVDAVLDVILPGHNEYGGNPLQTMTLMLPPHVTASGDVVVTVPGDAINGDYRARIGLIQGGDYNCSDLNYITIE